MKSVALKVFMVFIALALFAGCSTANNAPEQATTSTPKPTANQQQTAAPEAGSELDISERVELQFYMLGDPPKDMPIISEKINELALRDLNATVKFNFISFTDAATKYKLLLTSGQPADLIYTATWMQYQDYAKQGAFQPLDELLPKYAPVLNSFIPEDVWNTAKIGGKIMTVPSTYKEYTTSGFIYREDLRKKYNLPKPESIETYEAYLDGIKANEPDMFPVASGFNMRSYLELTVDHAGAFSFGLTAPYDNPRELHSYFEGPEYLEALKIAKRWADKGFWSKNVLNEKETPNNLVITGLSASIFSHNPTMFNDMNTKMQADHPDWELAYGAYPLFVGYATPGSPIGNGFAIPLSSKNPDRAIAFYEKMVTDKEYNMLTSYGIEGTHYEVVDGYYQMIGTPDTNGFGREAMNSWSWRNPEYMLFDKSFDGVKQIFDELDKIQQPNYFAGFVENSTLYQAEKAALQQVTAQYLRPLEMGLVDDVEAGLKLYLDKAKEAGLEKAQLEYTKQWHAYLDEIGM